MLNVGKTAQKSDWDQHGELLDVLQDDAKDIVAFIEHCSSDDLHTLNVIHGIESEIEIFDAVLSHPACDRATALQIFDLCNPEYYEQELAKGRSLDDYDDEEDRVFIAILDKAHHRLANRMNWRGKFDSPALRKWIKYPRMAPSLFSHWTLPAAVLAPTEGQQPNAMIEYRFSSIRLTYQAWQQRQ